MRKWHRPTFASGPLIGMWVGCDEIVVRIYSTHPFFHVTWLAPQLMEYSRSGSTRCFCNVLIMINRSSTVHLTIACQSNFVRNSTPSVGTILFRSRWFGKDDHIHSQFKRVQICLLIGLNEKKKNSTCIPKWPWNWCSLIFLFSNGEKQQT